MDSGAVVAGRYRLVDQVGEGGMGVVWRAVDVESDAPVALKQVRFDRWMTQSDREHAIGQLRREAGIATAVSDHANVVDVHGLVEHAGEPWLVMEFVPGHDLSRVVREGSTLPADRAARIGAQLAGAIAHLHRAGVVHGDVTPRNVLVSGDDDRVTLTDFGISRAESEQTMSIRGRPAGVPAFFAPEVAKGLRPSKASDVFGIGAVVQYMVDGFGPWGDSTDDRELYERALAATIVPSTNAGPLAPVLSKLLTRAVRSRPTAELTERMLADVAEGKKLPRRRGPLVLIAALVVVAALVATAIVINVQAPVPLGLGDHHTADPCALIEAAPFNRFGEARLETAYGGFERCDVVFGDGPQQVVVTARLDDGGPPPTSPVEQVGRLGVLRLPLEDDTCERVVRLPDGAEVNFQARIDELPAPPNLCEIADVATDEALPVLAAGVVPRRAQPFDAGSLANVDACSLLTPADFGSLPGFAGAPPDPGFGNWNCEWSGSGRSLVRFRFERDSRPVADAVGGGTPTTVGGRAASFDPDSDGSGCDGAVQGGTYRDQGNNTSYEMVSMQLVPLEPAADPCAALITIADAAARRMPQQ
ncbi:serine/threonine-protein kinase [Actinomycetes bacterium KLBMP 9759]